MKFISKGEYISIKSFFNFEISLNEVTVEVLNKIIELGYIFFICSAIVTPVLASPMLTPFIQIKSPKGLFFFFQKEFLRNTIFIFFGE